MKCTIEQNQKWQHFQKALKSNLFFQIRIRKLVKYLLYAHQIVETTNIYIYRNKYEATNKLLKEGNRKEEHYSICNVLFIKAIRSKYNNANTLILHGGRNLWYKLGSISYITRNTELGFSWKLRWDTYFGDILFSIILISLLTWYLPVLKS